MNSGFVLDEVLMESHAPVSSENPGLPGLVNKIERNLKYAEFERLDLIFGSIDLSEKNVMYLCKNPLDSNSFYLGAGEINILYDRSNNKKKADCNLIKGMFRVLPYKDYIIDLNIKEVTIYDSKGNVAAKSTKGAIVEYDIN